MTKYPTHWQEYELIDHGNYEKLERFGKYILIRPDTGAHWNRKLSRHRWKELAHVEFKYTSKKTGTWHKLKSMPDTWYISYPLGKSKLTIKLTLTKFKHVGLFPEQAFNWDFIYEQGKKLENKAKILNLFAYTGAASLAARAAGCQVTHVDSIRQVITWSRENMEISNLENIRWLVEDALKFVRKEAKRGNKYQGIIMDPPAWGLGPKGERWKLDEKLAELMEATSKILGEKGFLVLNTYSGLSPASIKNITQQYLSFQTPETNTELGLMSSQGVFLPLGSLLRIVRV